MALDVIFSVSTHSRPKAAASEQFENAPGTLVSTHSRPKAAATANRAGGTMVGVSTHSRPKAAAPYLKKQEKSAN